MKGLDTFLNRYARTPHLLRANLMQAGRIHRFNDEEVICRAGELAENFWIVERGTVTVGDGAKVVKRHPGQLIGEMAFFRTGDAVRTTAMKADGPVELLEIDRVFLDGLNSEQRLTWYEAVISALCEKVEEATTRRVELMSDNGSLDLVLRKFVCAGGLMEVNTAIKAQSNGIVPQRTQALVWFSDLAGFSAYSKDLSADEAGTLIRRFMDAQVEEIHKAGGEVDKFMGDGLMAFWRLPDEARVADRVPRAVRAAVSAIERITEMASRDGLPLDIRIGLHLGQVVIGDFGGSDRIAYTLIGETVNSASRYEQARSDLDNFPLGPLRLSPAVYSRMVDAAQIQLFEPDPRVFRAKHDQEFGVHILRKGSC